MKEGDVLPSGFLDSLVMGLAHCLAIVAIRSSLARHDWKFLIAFKHNNPLFGKEMDSPSKSICKSPIGCGFRDLPVVVRSPRRINKFHRERQRLPYSMSANMHFIPTFLRHFPGRHSSDDRRYVHTFQP